MRLETRRRARALQLLYLLDIVADTTPDEAVQGLHRLVGSAQGVLLPARQLAADAWKRRAELDSLCQAAAENWRLERLATIERNILRLGIAELQAGVTPAKVVLDESVWLAQRFGGEAAPGFVNGVLDRVARTMGRL